MYTICVGIDLNISDRGVIGDFVCECTKRGRAACLSSNPRRKLAARMLYRGAVLAARDRIMSSEKRPPSLPPHDFSHTTHTQHKAKSSSPLVAYKDGSLACGAFGGGLAGATRRGSVCLGVTDKT